MSARNYLVMRNNDILIKHIKHAFTGENGDKRIQIEDRPCKGNSFLPTFLYIACSELCQVYGLVSYAYRPFGSFVY